jgi:hypothetical protein
MIFFTSASMALPVGSVCAAFGAGEEARENKTAARGASFEKHKLMVNEIVVQCECLARNWPLREVLCAIQL